MRTPAAMLATSGIVILSLSCAPAADQGEASTEADPASQEMSFEEATALFDGIVEEWDAALNAEDVDALKALYADVPVSMPPNVPARVGLDVIRGWEADFFAQGEVEADNVFEGVRVSGDLAVGWGSYTLTITPEEGEAVSDAGKWVAIWERQADGSWRATRNIWNSDLPPAM